MAPQIKAVWLQGVDRRSHPALYGIWECRLPPLVEWIGSEDMAPVLSVDLVHLLLHCLRMMQCSCNCFACLELGRQSFPFLELRK